MATSRSSSHPSSPMVMWSWSRCLATHFYQWPVAKHSPITWLPFAIFHASFILFICLLLNLYASHLTIPSGSRKSARKLAGKVADLWVKISLPMYPFPGCLYSCWPLICSYATTPTCTILITHLIYCVQPAQYLKCFSLHSPWPMLFSSHSRAPSLTLIMHLMHSFNHAHCPWHILHCLHIPLHPYAPFLTCSTPLTSPLHTLCYVPNLHATSCTFLSPFLIHAMLLIRSCTHVLPSWPVWCFSCIFPELCNGCSATLCNVIVFYDLISWQWRVKSQLPLYVVWLGDWGDDVANLFQTRASHWVGLLCF